jgi:ABC-type nitrate/sulfonate/bicarbonate transport system ATPase subunit
MKEVLIKSTDIKKSYPKKEGKRKVDVLEGVTLSIHKGEFVVLLGPSGCGKSTFLRILSGLDYKTGGELVFADDYNPKKVSFVFQDFGVLPWLTVSENIRLNLIGESVPDEEQKDRTKEIIHKFGLTAFCDHYPHELSGGMRQRVGLARAFVSKPEVIFLDEPFSELDFFTAGELRNLLLELWEEEGTTVVMVSHYIDEAVTLADTIAVFSNRPSSIKGVVHNELSRPRDPRSAEFFKKEDTLSEFFKDEKLS